MKNRESQSRMSSARDERRGPYGSKDAANPTDPGSLADSVQSLRHLAENLSLPAIHETEKKLKQVIEQLAAMQESLNKLNQARSRADAPASQADAKRKPSSKAASPNVIPFPASSRSEMRSADADARSRQEGLDSRTEKDSATDDAPGPSPASERAENVESTFELAERARQDQTGASAPEPPPISPEIVASSEPLGEAGAIPARRSPAVDEEIRALVRQYGEVDIYSHREGGPRHLLKAALTGLFLIAALAVSYLFLL
ncbi:MAG TPA: hypothetical protein VNL14_12510 [Candidatus Acidoferrales bacterium]|nr:hypothetical protein [Candidatus Acidoferrales bacterium]